MSVLAVGTDCSGLDAPIQALKLMNVKIDHKFASNIDPKCRSTIDANGAPGVMYENMTARDNASAPKVDLYVAGFSCQPFSSVGKRLGTEDPRGGLFFSCLAYIKARTPKCFVLENVKGLKTINKGETFKYFLAELEALEDYEVHHQILNSKDFRVPHNRERIFFVGLRKDAVVKPFAFPAPQPTHLNLNLFIDRHDTK